jgi:uncharacterized protein YdeI (BOF family)
MKVKYIVIIVLLLLAVVLVSRKMKTSNYTEGVCDTAEYKDGFRCTNSTSNTTNNAVKCKEKCMEPNVWKK